MIFELEPRVTMYAQISESLLATSTIPTLSALSPIAVNLLIAFFLLICVAMILIVLIQRPQGGGLSGAFGAGGGSSGAGQTAFGTKTGDVLTWATIGIFVCFLVVAIILNFATRPVKNSIAEETLISAPAETLEDESAEESTSNDEQADSGDQSEDLPEDIADTIVDEVENVIDDQDIQSDEPANPANDG